MPDKLVIPEKIAIRLLNSSEVTAEQFYKHILEQYRILNQLQQQRQQFLQKQHIQLQQLAAGNRFQEIFATATIIQSNPNDPIKKPITPTNGTFLLEPPPPRSVTVDLLNGGGQVPILDTAPVMTHLTPKRKQHRKHYAGGHHRRMQKGGHKKPPAAAVGAAATAAAAESGASDGGSSTAGAAFLTPAETSIVETPLNPPTSVMQEPFVYTSMPIPLILNSGEDKRPPHHAHAHAHAHGEHRGGLSVGGAQARKRTTSATVAGYDAHSYLNPFLTGELIFEK